jgi:hypothetical protein
MDWLFMVFNVNPDVAVCFAYEWTMGVTAAVRDFARGCVAYKSYRKHRLFTPA